MNTNASPVRFYNLAAWFYDLVVGSDTYHRFVWGMPVREHEQFAQKALELSDDGPILDAGCGSLLFTARTYRQSQRHLTCLDGSRSMLARARRRIKDRTSSIDFVCDDLRALPLPDAAFVSVFHFGVLHCLPEAEQALAEMNRVLAPGGKLYVSTLVLQRPRGDSFLSALHKKGHVAAPRTSIQVQRLITGAGFEIVEREQRGSFAFFEARKVSPPALSGGL